MTTDERTWFITGAGRGMGVDFRQGCAGRRPQRRRHRPQPGRRRTGARRLRRPAGRQARRHQRAGPEAAAKAAVDRFGGIDVLVNNAASFYAGYFEELTPEQMERQLATSLIGPMNVTRAVLPVMRKQRSGHVVTISSSAVPGQEHLPPTLLRLSVGCENVEDLWSDLDSALGA